MNTEIPNTFIMFKECKNKNLKFAFDFPRYLSSFFTGIFIISENFVALEQ